MATFTQDEIETIKEKGNEHCRRIWLGLGDPPTPKILDPKDEQKMKDLMISKYELKRFYLDPSVLNRTRVQKSPPTTNKAQSNPPAAIPRVPITSTTQRSKNPDSVNANTFNGDFVADFSKVQDPFSAATTTQQFNQSFTPQPSFANFDNNPVFNSPKSE